jgi:hypothetical protein
MRRESHTCTRVACFKSALHPRHLISFRKWRLVCRGRGDIGVLRRSRAHQGELALDHPRFKLGGVGKAPHG